MKTVLETCTPRQSILTGAFNPEVFTAALGPVIQYYRSGEKNIDAVYADANLFFREATFPTEGLKQTVSNVFRRIAGDQSVPSIQRMETAFGGGKTHSLIACVHIAYRGKELAGVTDGILEPEYLPDPNSVSVVGIAGDELPVIKTKGDKIIPYTLWGELAYQVGGEHLYQQVKAEAESFAAPGKNFLETILGGRKVLIMLDELAQYAARIEVAVPNQGANQLAAFIMALNGYAKSHAGVALIVTLAGATDAFSKQTERLTDLLNKTSTDTMNQDDAVALAERANKGITSVVMRDATAVTPVQATEISAVLAKRLFEHIDATAAQEAVDAYAEMYQRNSGSLPEEATDLRFRDRMRNNYPFHPTLIDFLNNKLAQAENFQGTRGVLRMLAMTIRSIWNKKAPVQVIHVSDIDMQNSAIVNELLGKTGSADLRQVLNADIGSVDTHNLQGGLSNAQRADKENPHPDGIPLYENTWKTVFLNSLVGRSEGVSSKVFGVSQQDAIFMIATPLLAPAQVKVALEKISESAFYLRYENGKYFAHLDPTINSVLAMIRQTIDQNRVDQKLRSITSSMIQDNHLFRVEHDVRLPQDIVDNMDKPLVAVVTLDAGEINLGDMFKTVGDYRPRIRQNMVVLLVPQTVKVTGEETEQISLEDQSSPNTEAINRLVDIAKQVLAIKTLEDDPRAYGIAASKLNDPEFQTRKKERNLALFTSVNAMYSTFYFATANGFEHKNLRTAAGEGGLSILDQIRQTLYEVGQLVYSESDRFGTAVLRSLADTYFFDKSDKASCSDLLSNFFNYRSWPMLPSKDTLEKLLREGVESGVWTAYKMSEDPTDSFPAEFYSQQKPLPFSISLIGGKYSIMSVAGAKKRGWTESDKAPNEKVKAAIKDVMQNSGAATIRDISTVVTAQLTNATEEQIKTNIQDLIQSGGYNLYQGQPQQQNKPSNMINGFNAFNHEPAADEVLISVSEQSERGWNSSRNVGIRLDGNDGAKKIFPLLRRIGSLYNRNGAKSTIDELDITDMQLPSGGTLRIALENATPADLKRLDELFQVLSEVAKVSSDTEAELRISNPSEDCAFVKELGK